MRALDDPFDGPTEHQFKCASSRVLRLTAPAAATLTSPTALHRARPNPKGYARGAPQEMSLFDTFRFGLYIDFESLTVDFGRQLRRHIHDHDGSPAPGARASGGAIEHDGSVAHRPRASAPPPAVSA